MNENKKKINIIDIGVILIILLFVVGIGIRFFHSTSQSLKDTVTLEYTVLVKDIRQYTVDALSKSSKITDEDSNAQIGEIISISEATPYVSEGVSFKGELVSSVVPNKFQTVVTIRATARNTNDRYFLTEDIEASLGKDFTIVSKYVQTTGQITSIKEVSSEN